MKNTLVSIFTTYFMIAVSVQIYAMDYYPPSLKAGLIRDSYKTHSRSEDEELSPYIPMLLQIESSEIEDTLASMGVIIYRQREHILLASIPRDSVDNVLELPQIINAEMTGDLCTQLDVARPMCHVDALQSAFPPLDHTYDGSGIVVGFSDIGFDARHIAFKDRISAIYNYNARKGLCQKAETAEEIAAWTTDDPDEYHATHVGNILGRNYRGAPYWGVATGAEMVATTSTLTDVGILAGVEDIIAYAKSQNKRAVINLSLGSFLGPHDGTSLFCRYISSCTKDAVICLSAGNKGNTQCYATATISDSNTIKRIVTNDLATWTGKSVEGATQIWSANDRPFSIRAEIFDKDTKEIVYASKWTNPYDGLDEIYISGNEDEDFARYMDGLIYACAGISKLNGRFYAETAYSVSCEETQATSGGKWARYAVAIAVKGVDENLEIPTYIEFFADATTSFIGIVSRDDSPVFSYGGTISDMCTAEGVISVGNCSSRNTAPSLYGENGTVTWDFNVGEPEINSSFSTSPYIGRYPLFSAPGNMVVSALSGEYVKTHPSDSPDITAVSTVDGNDYYWMAASGTSMSSPIVAGIIAQWLQANPGLSTSEIIEIARTTCTTDLKEMSNPRWGAGCINALAGLKKAIEMNGIADSTNDSLSIYNSNGKLSLPSGSEVYTIDGLRISSTHNLSKGVYLIVCPNAQTHKIFIR